MNAFHFALPMAFGGPCADIAGLKIDLPIALERDKTIAHSTQISRYIILYETLKQ